MSLTYSELGIFSKIETSLLGNVEALFDKSSDLIVSISPIFSLAFGIYVLLQVFHYYNKGFDDSLMDISKRMVGWIVIIALAFNANGYKEVAKTAYNLPNNLSQMVAGKEYKASSMDDNFTILNQKLSNIDEMRKKLGAFDFGDKMVFGTLKIVNYLLLGLLMVFCFAYYLVAKLSLVLVLMFGPIFIGCLLFPATRQWGMSWINQVMNYSLVMACYVLIGVMQQEFVTNHIITALTEMDTSGDVMAYLFMLIFISIIATVVFMLVSWNIPSVVAGIVGGGAFSGNFRSIRDLKSQGKSKSGEKSSSKGSMQQAS